MIKNWVEIHVSCFHCNPCPGREVDGNSGGGTAKKDATNDCAFTEFLHGQVGFFHTQKAIELGHPCDKIGDERGNFSWCGFVNNVDDRCHEPG